MERINCLESPCLIILVNYWLRTNFFSYSTGKQSLCSNQFYATCKQPPSHAKTPRTFIFELRSTFHSNMTTKKNHDENPQHKMQFCNYLVIYYLWNCTPRIIKTFVEMTIKNLVAKHLPLCFRIIVTLLPTG